MTVTAKPNPLAELLVTLIIPSLILMKLSGPDSLGAVNALLLALAFPLFWGARDLFVRRKLNLLAALGLLNILLTGGIGLLQMDTQWLAIKEAAIPGLIGLGTVVSAHTRYPLVRIVLFSESLMNVERIQQRLSQRGNSAVFDARLKVATWMLGGSFFFSALMNYTLAIWIVVSPAGTTAFNEELGRLTLLSYPMIALPSMLIMVAVLYYMARSIRELAGLKLAEALKR
jgi:hypothetical protein